ncbi:MAG TPA: hypothetical protein VMH61_02770 [Candidatus Acidoferrales bacterium]|nr:hypothetical protein [Candidatus Acidoferrales bacterium]
MTATDTGEPDGALRGLLEPGGGVTLVARRASFPASDARGPASHAERPSALELLLGALAADLLGGLARECRRAGLGLRDAELRLRARLENPLVALGVVGEEGSPAVRSIEGALHASGVDTAPLEAAWATVMAHSPAYATLARATSIRIEVRPLP